MLLYLFLAFTLLPVLELMILFRLAAALGPISALVLVIGTGFFGAALARREGVLTLNRLQRELGAGKVPTQELMDAFTLLAAGLLLITPGALTDCAGFALLFRPTRRLFQQVMTRYFKKRVVVGGFSGFQSGPAGPNGPTGPSDEPGTYTVEYETVDDEEKKG